MIHRFADGAAIGEMDCVCSSWVGTRPQDSGGQVEALRGSFPPSRWR